MRYLKKFFCFIGVCTVALFVCTVVTCSQFRQKTDLEESDPFCEEIKANIFSLGTRVTEIKETEFFISFDLSDDNITDEISFIRYLTALERASHDDRVKGIFIKLDDANIPFSNVYEISKVLKQFNKPIYSYGADISNSAYLLACNSNVIYMHPCGLLNLIGVCVSVPFMKKLCEKIGISFYVEKREAYKTYADMYSEYNMSQFQKENLQSIISNIRKLFYEQLSKRGVTGYDDIINSGPFSSSNAIRNKLVDKISSYPDALKDLKWTKRFIKLSDYAYENLEKSSEPRVAVICLQGTIVDDLSKSPESTFSHESITRRDIRKLISKMKKSGEKYAAYIVRINSPGGSAVASEDVLCELNSYLKNENVPVYVSMGSYAASGGYWIACGLTNSSIFATPYTFTGSVGVVSVVPVIAKLTNKLGINVEKIVSNTSSSFGNIMHDLSPIDQSKYAKIVDELYDLFIERVSNGRKLTVEDVKHAAKGRVWLGSEALRLKLIDQIGGFLDVIEDIKKNVKSDTVSIHVIQNELSILSIIKSKLRSICINMAHYLGINNNRELLLETDSTVRSIQY